MPGITCNLRRGRSRRALWATAALAALLAGALLTSGCGALRDAPPPLDGRVHVEVWSMWVGDEQADFENVVRYYNKTHPGVVVENLGAVDDDKTVRAIVAGVPPDVVTISTAAYLGTLAANNALLPLDARFAASTLKTGDYTPGALGQCEYQGRLYALPYLLDCSALLYNKDTFKAAGLNPDKPPRTWEEMQADCVKLVKRDADGRLTRIGIKPFDAATLLGVYGGGLFDAKTGRVTADTPGNVRAMRMYKSLMDAEGGFEAVDAFGLGFSTATSNYDPFYRGQIGMEFDGEWNPYLLYKFSPSTHYGVAPLPYPASDPAMAGTVWLGANPLCIPREAAHPQAAWEFIRWTQTPVAQRMFAMQLHNIPNMRAALRDPALRTGAVWRPKFGLFMNYADDPNAKFFPPLPVASLYTNQLSNALDSVCYGRLTPQAALRAVQQRTQREMDKYGS